MTGRGVRLADLLDFAPGELFWRGRAACLDYPPDMFFPESAGGGRADADAARAVCRLCPVQAACLEYALDNKIRDGVWGGTTEKQRRRLLRDRRALQQEQQAS